MNFFANHVPLYSLSQQIEIMGMTCNVHITSELAITQICRAHSSGKRCSCMRTPGRFPSRYKQGAESSRKAPAGILGDPDPFNKQRIHEVPEGIENATWGLSSSFRSINSTVACTLRARLVIKALACVVRNRGAWYMQVALWPKLCMMTWSTWKESHLASSILSPTSTIWPVRASQLSLVSTPTLLKTR